MDPDPVNPYLNKLPGFFPFIKIFNDLVKYGIYLLVFSNPPIDFKKSQEKNSPTKSLKTLVKKKSSTSGKKFISYPCGFEIFWKIQKLEPDPTKSVNNWPQDYGSAFRRSVWNIYGSTTLVESQMPLSISFLLLWYSCAFLGIAQIYIMVYYTFFISNGFMERFFFFKHSKKLLFLFTLQFWLQKSILRWSYFLLFIFNQDSVSCSMLYTCKEQRCFLFLKPTFLFVFSSHNYHFETNLNKYFELDEFFIALQASYSRQNHVR